MAFEGTEPNTISICVDCVYFLAYGRLDDTTMEENPNAGTEHAAKIHLRWGEFEITPGCGSTCEEHGSVDDRDDDEPEPWFSWSPCEGCGSSLGGYREHATAWVPTP